MKIDFNALLDFIIWFPFAFLEITYKIAVAVILAPFCVIALIWIDSTIVGDWLLNKYKMSTTGIR
jgi:hypothetical protein